MKKHLLDQDVDSLLCGEEVDRERMEHLQICLSCRKKVEDFRALLDAAAHEMEAEIPEVEEQLDAILQRIAPRSQGPGIRGGERRHSLSGVRKTLMLAAATLLLILGGLSLRPGWRQSAPHPTPRPELQIEEILSTADALLADNSIPGFEGLDDLDESAIDVVLDSENS